MPVDFQRHPFLRLLLPLVLGIVCGDLFPNVALREYYGVLSAVLLSVLFLLYRYKQPFWFSCCVSLTLVAIGYFHMSAVWCATAFEPSTEKCVHKVRLLDDAELKARSTMCKVEVLDSYLSDSCRADVPKGFFLLYFPKNVESATLRCGDELLVMTQLTPPRNSGNPDEFDYVKYLRRSGGAGTAYVPDGHWQVVGHDAERSFTQQAMGYRKRVVEQLRYLGFKEDNLAVLSALLLGDKEGLSDEIVETYAVSGASHVLALSGLHIGFLYALLFFLLSPLWKWKSWMKPVAILLIVLLLWLFAFFTGLSSSVVRSVTMFTIMSVAMLMRKDPLSLNVVAASAFLMLLVNPAWLFNVGFQLSYSAVVAILLLQPKLASLWQVENRLLRYVWGLLTVSVAAQIGTMPWVMFYFSRFSTHFLLTNLWVIPLVSVVLYAAVLMLLLTPFPTLQVAFAPVVDWLLSLQHGGLRMIEQLPYSSIDGICIDGWEVLLLFAAIFAFYYLWHSFSVRRMQLFLFSLLISVVYHTVQTHCNAPHASIAFYNMRNNPVVHCLTDGKHSWLVGTDSLPNVENVKSMLTSYWLKMRLETPQSIGEGYSDANIQVQDRILTYGGKRVCLLYDDFWKKKTVDAPLHVDVLFVSKGYKGGVKELCELFAFDNVVIDSSLTGYYREKITQDCRELNISCRLLSDGAVNFFL